jgi:hypothetical protein
MAKVEITVADPGDLHDFSQPDERHSIPDEHQGLRDLVGSLRAVSESKAGELIETERYSAIHTFDGAGTVTSSAPEVALIDQLNSKGLAIDSNDPERLQQFETIASNTRETFDSEGAQHNTFTKPQPIEDASVSQWQRVEDQPPREALHQELQRTNAQTPELAAIAQHGSNDCLALITEVADTFRKLNDAAGKLDKAIAGSQKLILLKD